MKTLGNIFLWFVIIGTFSYSAFLLFAPPCRNPIEYKIGTFDNRFGVSEAKFIAAAKRAEAVWEDATGKDLFNYDPKGDLPLNLVFDERQETAILNKTLESKVDETESSAKIVRAQFEDLQSRYEASKADYEAMIASYKELQQSYNSKVESWNAKGGAPKSEYSVLENQKKELQKMFGLLEQRRLEVNSLAEEVNALVSKYNYLVKTVNSNIEVINQSADREFEQGEYIYSGGEQKINVYEFYSVGELERILAHEFGHAIGMGHNENPKSILYYLNEGDSLEPSAEDIRDLKKVCHFK
jgi:hypothetical protein